MLSISRVTPSELDHAYNLIGGILLNVISKTCTQCCFLKILIICNVIQIALSD